MQFFRQGLTLGKTGIISIDRIICIYSFRLSYWLSLIRPTGGILWYRQHTGIFELLIDLVQQLAITLIKAQLIKQVDQHHLYLHSNLVVADSFRKAFQQSIRGHGNWFSRAQITVSQGLEAAV